jgi:pSer/pThr/pTyr-binding forkhead associated (FHA) protein
MNIRIEVLSGPLDGKIFNITRSSDIGRDPASPVSLPLDRFLSRRHARILVADPECFLEDLESRNGTLIRGELLKGRVLLANGDRFRAGQTVLEVTW